VYTYVTNPLSLLASNPKISPKFAFNATMFVCPAPFTLKIFKSFVLVAYKKQAGIGEGS